VSNPLLCHVYLPNCDELEWNFVHWIENDADYSDKERYVVVQVVEAMLHKSEGCGFDVWWGYSDFSLA
jgi:hypothetical protein